jgi:hypothetical protein
VHICRLGLSRWIGRIQQHANDPGIGHELVQKLQAFRFQESSELNEAGRVPARPVDASDETQLDRVKGAREHDRDGRRGGFSSLRRKSACARGDDDGYLTTHQLDGEARQTIVLTLGPAIFDRHVAAFDIAVLYDQSLAPIQ